MPFLTKSIARLLTLKLDALFANIVLPNAVPVPEKEITMTHEPRNKNVDKNETMNAEIKWFLIPEKPHTYRNRLQSLLWVVILSQLPLSL